MSHLIETGQPVALAIQQRAQSILNPLLASHSLFWGQGVGQCCTVNGMHGWAALQSLARECSPCGTTSVKEATEGSGMLTKSLA